MHRWYAALSYGIAALGLLHVAAATQRYEQLTHAAVWFTSGGLVMILTAALNLLNRQYGRSARGLRWVCFATNILVTAFAAIAGAVGHASAAQLIIVIGLFGTTTVLASLPGALLPNAVTPAEELR